MYEQGSSPPMFQYSLEMLRKMRVRGGRSGIGVSDMKIRQWEGKRVPLSLLYSTFLNMWYGARWGVSEVARFFL